MAGLSSTRRRRLLFVLKRAVEAGASGERHGDIHQDPRIDRTIYREPIDFSRFPSDQSIDKKNGHQLDAFSEVFGPQDPKNALFQY